MGLVTDTDAAGQMTPETQVRLRFAGSGNTAGQMLTVDEAKALADVGLTSDQVTFVKSRLDDKKGRQLYNVEFYTASCTEYDYEIDAYIGKIVRFNCGAEDHITSSGGSAITMEKGKELTLAQVPGAAANDIREFKTDYDDGRTEYEGKIVYNSIGYEFEIDGYSGACLQIKAVNHMQQPVVISG